MEPKARKGHQWKGSSFVHFLFGSQKVYEGTEPRNHVLFIPLKVPAWTKEQADAILEGSLTPMEVTPKLLVNLSLTLDPNLLCNELLGKMFEAKSPKGDNINQLEYKVRCRNKACNYSPMLFSQ